MRAMLAWTLASLSARGAPPREPKVLGALFAKGDEEAFRGSLRRDLGELGYVEGRNLAIEWRFTGDDEGEIATAARDLVAHRVDAIATYGTSRTRAVRLATRSIPVVTGVGDALASGFAVSLARPGGNVTGLTGTSVGVETKMIEILRRLLPDLSRLAIVVAEEYRASRKLYEPMVAAAGAAGVQAEMSFTDDAAVYDKVFAAYGGSRARAVYVGRTGVRTNPRSLAARAIARKCPVLAISPDMVEAGFLVSYSLRHADGSRRIARMLDEIFNGADPAVIPFELPTKSHLAINKTTAAKLGIGIPEDLLLITDRLAG